MKIVKPNKYSGVLNTINHDFDKKETTMEQKRWT